MHAYKIVRKNFKTENPNFEVSSKSLGELMNYSKNIYRQKDIFSSSFFELIFKNPKSNQLCRIFLKNEYLYSAFLS